jgi:RNA polymerase sigma-70 factor (ECF subfamily)
MNTQLTDLHLVELTLAGSHEAFEVLVHRYACAIHGLAASMLRSEVEAQDVVQETFLAAFRKLESFSRSSPFRAWLYRIATNACLMRLRSRRRRPEVSLQLRSPGFDEEDHHERPVVDWSPLADKLLQDRELGERIRGEVERLPEKYRAVLVLADYHHLSMRDIALSLDLTVPNVKTRLHRARLSVREGLDAYLAGVE